MITEVHSVSSGLGLFVSLPRRTLSELFVCVDWIIQAFFYLKSCPTNKYRDKKLKKNTC